MLRKMPFMLAVIIAAIILLDPIIPFFVKQLLYSISLSIKTIIVALLPLIIFSLLFKAAVILSKSATKIIGIIIIMVCCSNFIATFLSRFVGMWVYSFDISMLNPTSADDLVALWALKLQAPIANDKAMVIGVLLGIIAPKLWSKKSLEAALVIEKVVAKILDIVIYFIPLFVAGFVIKMQHDGVMNSIIKDYTSVCVVIVIAQFGYIALAYLLLNSFVVRNFMHNIKSMIPAAISGFSTMSSAASMPLTILGVESNAQNKDIARSVVPATVNIHLFGDCFAIPIFAYTTLKSFGMLEPTLWQYLIFSGYFVLAKFSVAAIPGGGILVMLPILETYLGFNTEMMSLITALYIMFDPIITSANVFGNGAFAKMIDNLFVYLQNDKKKN